MDNREKLSRLARRLSTACLMLLVVILGGSAMAASYFLFDPVALADHFDHVGVEPSRLDFAIRAGVLAVNGITVVLIAMALGNLRRAFEIMAGEEPFTELAARCVTHGGGWLAAGMVYGVLAKTLTSILLTINNPPGQRHVMIGLSSTDMLGLLAAGALFALGLILLIAAELDRENRGFV